MSCLCRCFHMLLTIMCSITFVSEMGLYLAGSDLRLFLWIGVTSA